MLSPIFTSYVSSKTQFKYRHFSVSRAVHCIEIDLRWPCKRDVNIRNEFFSPSSALNLICGLMNWGYNWISRPCVCPLSFKASGIVVVPPRCSHSFRRLILCWAGRESTEQMDGSNYQWARKMPQLIWPFLFVSLWLVSGDEINVIKNRNKQFAGSQFVARLRLNEKIVNVQCQFESNN